MSFALFTLHTLLHTIICCLQLNTRSDADADLRVDYLGTDVLDSKYMYFVCNAQLNLIMIILS